VNLINYRTISVNCLVREFSNSELNWIAIANSKTHLKKQNWSNEENKENGLNGFERGENFCMPLDWPYLKNVPLKILGRNTRSNFNEWKLPAFYAIHIRSYFYFQNELPTAATATAAKYWQSTSIFWSCQGCSTTIMGRTKSTSPTSRMDSIS